MLPCPFNKMRPSQGMSKKGLRRVDQASGSWHPHSHTRIDQFSLLKGRVARMNLLEVDSALLDSRWAARRGAKQQENERQQQRAGPAQRRGPSRPAHQATLMPLKYAHSSSCKRQ